MLEAARREVLNDEKILEMYPQLNAIDLAEAWNYVAENKLEIEPEMKESEAA